MTDQFPDLPKILGSYTIRQELSTGHSRVYSADDQNFGIEVVIKILPHDYFEDSDFLTRFKQDIQTLAAANLTGVLPVYDLGEYKGYPYLVQRYMPGGTLADRLKNGPLELDEVTRILQKVSKALDSAHRRGILHLNLKPSNILFDENDEPYLSDFGLVKTSSSSELQVMNAIDGAPAYSSPEQALGQYELDNRSDVYALGSLVYEMLTGSKPFPHGNLVSQAAQHVTSLAVDLLKLQPDLPVGCAAVVEWAMCKDPELRYQSAPEFAAVFTQQADPEIYQAAESRAFNRRLRIVLMSLLALILLGVSVGILTDVIDLDRAKNNVLAYIAPSPTSTFTLTPSVTPTRVTPTLTASSIPTTPAPSETFTPRPPTSTPMLTFTPSNTPVPTVSGPIVGFANRIAVINENNIYVMRLDGTDVEKLTDDQSTKEDLQWMPDGHALTYRTNGCYTMLSYPGRVETQLGCFSDFEVSHDQTRMVIGDKIVAPNANLEWWNFIGPFDILLQGLMNKISLTPTLGGCPFVGGTHTDFSLDSETLAAVFESSIDGRPVDVIRLFKLLDCGEGIDVIDTFPAERFTLQGYLGKNDDPRLYDFGWDGATSFAVHGNKTRTKFGDMVIYTRTENNVKAETLAPIDNQCCYQDIQWSPDGTYLLFVFQDNRTLAKTSVYYEPFSTLRENLPRQPLPFPDGFFANPDARVEPALRPALP